MKRFWKTYHKWAGWLLTFFLLMFCFSGIVLNHRYLFSGCEVNRSWLPGNYQYTNWSNGMIKGTLRLPDGEVLVFGNAGVWLTDSCFSAFAELNEGIDKGIDRRKMSNVVHLPDGSVWCAALYDVYCLQDNRWEKRRVKRPDEAEERIADLTTRGDTLVVLTRSHIYHSVPPYTTFAPQELPAPAGYAPRVSLFRTVWALHSGELFGLPGRLVVDLLGVALAMLCLTGLGYGLLPPLLRRRKRRKLPVTPYARLLKHSVRWHHRLGTWPIVFTVLLAATGMCLRPPLMIPLVLTSTAPLPGSTLDADDAWHDKLRSLRWDDELHSWLLSTSDGFYAFTSFHDTPVRMMQAPSVSPMGINVFTRCAPGEWLVGSFSGLFRWHVATGEVTDYFTGQPPATAAYGRPIGRIPVAGYSSDLATAEAVVFDYENGARGKGTYRLLPPPPEALLRQPMSLWHFCLELHTGRLYTPLLGRVSVLYVFLSGLLLTLLLVSGYLVYRRRRRH